MKNKMLIAAIILASSAANADYVVEGEYGQKFIVYSETIERVGDNVTFTIGGDIEDRIETQDVYYNCATHRDVVYGYVAPGTVVRYATDYVCNLTNDIE